MTKQILEVCAYNIQSCLIAEAAGGSRIELCANPTEGGVTPSIGTIELVVEKVSIPSYIMIRPRGGNFVYDANELAVMERDIVACKKLGCPGIVLGLLTVENKVDIENTRRLVELAGPMSVTFHKAFDRVSDPFEALESVIATGCNRILTSGLLATALDGAQVLKKLTEQAAGRIIIMPGGGVRSCNIEQLAQVTGAVEFHSSCILDRNSQIADSNEISAIIDNLKSTLLASSVTV